MKRESRFQLKGYQSMNTLANTMQALGASTGLDKETCDEIEVAVSKYLTRMDRKIQSEGKTKTCEYYKSLHKCATNIVLHSALPVIPFCKSNKEGIPLDLTPVLSFIMSDDARLQRIGLTITRMYEKIVLPKQWNPLPITEEGPKISEQLISEFKEFCSDWTVKIGARNVVLERLDKIKGRLVRGPNGPGIVTSHYDARAVYDDKTLYQNLSRLATLMGCKWIIDLMYDLAIETPNKGFCTGRISLIQEGGGKTRTIAIGDYWTQNVLQTIHDKLMSTLRRLRTDGTYDQGNQVERISTLSKGHKTFCFDLSNATDRFPLVLQEILLSFVFTNEIAHYWSEVLRSRSFKYQNDEVSWKVGQPLGLLSSWPAFSLTHHALIEFCAKCVGYKSFTDYAVLGDDVVIWNERVANYYKDLLGLLGVPINMSKSVVSSDGHHRIEFAKRIIYNGVERTGIKYCLISQSGTLYGFIDLIRLARLTNWELIWGRIVFPSSHSVKWKEHLSILLWDASKGNSALDPHMWGGDTDTPKDVVTYEMLKNKVLELRVESLRNKRDTLDRVLLKAKPIEDLFKRGGIDVSAHLIGLNGYSQSLHPIVWALNQAGEEIIISLDLLEKVLDGEIDEIPDTLPVEFLPIPIVNQYFGEKHLLRSKTRTTFVLKAWTQLTENKRI
jgi:hypothetical protein